MKADEPAIPVMDDGGCGQHYGLTKREYFAVLAMQGLVSNSRYPTSLKDIARNSVRIADALLKELEK